MKKLVLILIGLLFSYISFSQDGKREMSNYEKYLLAKEAQISQDTIYKTDTVLVGEEKREWDDLYYTPSKDQLKLKSKELRLRKREIRMEQDSMYYDAKKEVYNDLSFTANIYRFHRPYYGFGYYNYYWDPFYDPWFLDSWYYGGYPYFGFGYPYYHSYWGFGFGYHNWYGWGYPYYPNYYGYNHYGNNHHNYYGSNDRNSVQYGRRERPSNLSSTYSRRQPVTVNRTVQIDRSTGRTVSVTNNNRRVSTTTDRPSYNNQTRTQNRNYTPSYQSPRLSTRPLYNNTNTNRGNSYTAPTERRTVTPSQSTQSRNSYSTPRTSTNRSSNYSTPSRSYNSGSSSRSSNLGSSYSAPSRSSSGSSFSGGSSSRGSSSGGSSGSSSSRSSSGRR